MEFMKVSDGERNNDEFNLNNLIHCHHECKHFFEKSEHGDLYNF